MGKPRYKQVPLSALAPGDIFWKMPNRKRFDESLPRLHPVNKPIKGVLVGHFVGESWPMVDVMVFPAASGKGREIEVWAGARVWVIVG